VSPLLKAFCQRLNGPKKAESTLTSKKAVLTERERGRGREKKGREREKGRRESATKLKASFHHQCFIWLIWRRQQKQHAHSIAKKHIFIFFEEEKKFV